MNAIRIPSRLLLLTVMMASIFPGCLNVDGPEKPQGDKSIETMVVPQGFAYETYEAKTIQISALDNKDLPLEGVPIYVYADSASSKAGLLLSGQTDAAGKWTGELSVEQWREEVIIHTPYIGIQFDRIVPLASATTQVRLGGSNPDRYEEPTGNPEIGSPARVQRTDGTDIFAERYVYIGSYDSNGVPDYLELERDAVPQDILDLINNSLPEGSQVPNDNPQYIPAGRAADTKLTDSAAVWVTFVHEGAGYKNALGYYTYDLSNPPASTDDIDSLYIIFPNSSFLYSGGGLTTGDKVKLGNFSPNTGIGWFLVNDGWNSSTQAVKDVSDTKWSNPNFNTFTTSSNQQHVALLQDPVREILLLGMEDIARPGGDKDFNDAVFYVSANPFTSVDTTGIPETQPAEGDDDDEDGVLDENDNYPDDPTKAFDSYSPGENVFGSLAFEDLWPKTGDYDMNDVVVDYNVQFVTDVSNAVAQLRIKLAVKALGGSLKNGFGIELNCDPADISSVTGAQLNRNIVTLSANGTEAGQAKAVVIAFDDGHKFMGINGGAFMNTEAGSPVYTPDTVELVIDFANPIPKSQLGYAPFNPFIFINATRGREVHLVDNTPTSLADASYFGTEGDDSDPTAGRYYQTSRGLPWAIQLPAAFSYPLERVPVPSAHLKFIEWVESSGNLFSDWYLNESGYRDQNDIY